MAINDSASNEIRYNLVSNELEYAIGDTWASAGAASASGGTFTGSVDFSGASTTFTPPKLTSTERDALTATAGMLIYNTTTNKLNVRVAAAWEVVTSA